MANSRLQILNADGQTAHIDIEVETTDSDGRQVVVLGDPTSKGRVAGVRFADPTSSDGGVIVRDPNTTAIVSGLRDVRVQSIVDGSISIENITRVRNVIDGTLSTVSRVDRVFNLVDGTLSTIPRVDRVFNIVDGTISSIPRVDRVFNIVDGTISTIPRVDRVFNLIDGTISTVTRVDRVHNVVDGTISTITRVDRVHNLVDGTISTLPVLNISATAVLPRTASASTSAVSASGATIVSPESGRVIKVFAFSLTTTAQVHLNARFTNGAGTGPTEFWRVALQAPSQGIAGANLAVTPPSYIFATAAGNTLSLLLDSASLVHYSVGYFKESD